MRSFPLTICILILSCSCTVNNKASNELTEDLVQKVKVEKIVWTQQQFPRNEAKKILLKKNRYELGIEGVSLLDPVFDEQENCYFAESPLINNQIISIRPEQDGDKFELSYVRHFDLILFRQGGDLIMKDYQMQSGLLATQEIEKNTFKIVDSLEIPYRASIEDKAIQLRDQILSLKDVQLNNPVIERAMNLDELPVRILNSKTILYIKRTQSNGDISKDKIVLNLAKGC